METCGFILLSLAILYKRETAIRQEVYPFNYRWLRLGKSVKQAYFRAQLQAVCTPCTLYSIERL